MASSKLLPGIVFVLLLTALGFVTGGLVGATFFVQPGDGLAAAGTAAFSALVGGVLLLGASLWLVTKMPREQLLRGLVVALVGVLLAAVLLWQKRQQREAERARSQQRVEAVEGPPMDQSARNLNSSAQPRAA